jgi:hypothetical protein
METEEQPLTSYKSDVFISGGDKLPELSRYQFWSPVTPLPRQYQEEGNRVVVQTGGTTIYARNVYLDSRSQVVNVANLHPSAAVDTSTKALDASTSTGPVVSLRLLLVVGGLMLLIVGVGAIVANGLSNEVVVHPFLVGIVIIAGMTFTGMSFARLQ